jgi:uncharacterized metal-binding protein YceD (DUF177 family)
MTNLKIPLSRITESGLTIDVRAESGELQPVDALEMPTTPVRVRGVFTPASEQVLFRGRITGAFQGGCDRCLRAIELPFDLEVVWVFAPTASPAPNEGEPGEDAETEEDEEIFAIRGDEIDLSLLVWEEMVLGLPSRFIPCPDDEGKCVECGANLTEPLVWRQEDEAESPTASNRGLAGLADLFPDLKPKESEE